MRKSRRLALTAATALALLAVGIPYWRIPYASLALPDSVLTPALLVPLLGAALARLLGGASIWRATFVVGLSVPGAILIRVVIDVLADPASHNLWPFELILACGVGFPVALAGALLGSALMLALGKAAPD